ncbi:phytoene/squalene synthase family protein [Mangrovibacterium diazotrophicum]|uniref:Phytoene/squalene synthetase n=1 Tax=Mangrovibacterium diazotrophicum TaxID=1261403 RepID=A0A419W8M0_9BACT|nr:phytoene/squalene synthase family protein [Mangrovibacterium diazotrophicum]RKD91811.1 phytoene/squalene synthetase [Mangrovibacterium diazotrophicum]
MELYRKNNLDCSRITTRNYSTSFSLGVRMLNPTYRRGIYSIYGFVRYADEIVDTFFEQDQQTIFNEFKAETWKALERRFSINPIIDSFQQAVHDYSIDRHLIEAFLHSMEMDLYKSEYDESLLETYIYGSAEVVGLMCLRVFYFDEPEKYDELVEPARKLGAAFQKVNFLRDAQDDFENKGRIYFKNIDFRNFDTASKEAIEQEIEQDFKDAYAGIRALKKEVRFGVYLAYIYYLRLFRKIQHARPIDILRTRFRVSNRKKIYLLANAYLKNAFNIL